MTTFSRPGVFVQEVPLSQAITVADNSTSLGAFVGVLSKGPTTPTLVQSWSDFVKAFGTYNSAYPTSFAAYTFFANGGRGAYVLRIAGADAVASSVTLTDGAATPLSTLKISASSVGAWGNDLSVEVKTGVNNKFNLFVYGAPSSATASNTSNLLEQYTDLSMDPTDSRYAVAVINTLSAYVVATDMESATAAPNNNPLPGGLKALSGGVDDNTAVQADYAAATAKFDNITNPMVFNFPDLAYKYVASSDTAAEDRADLIDILSDALIYAEGRGDAFVVVDTPAGLTGAEAITFAADLSTGAAAGASGVNAAVYYPWVSIPDVAHSIPGATKLLPPGGAVVGQYLATDASRGVFKAPAGLGNRVALAVATERLLTNSELDDLNSASVPVNAIRNVPGAGIVIMGARTMRNVPGDRYVNARRSIIYIKRQIENLSAFAVFENNDARLRNQLRTSISSFLASYWSQGGLRGNTPESAYYVVCDSSNNTEADVLNGRVNIEVGVAVEYPAEFVVITLGQITGSASVAQG